MVEIPFMGKTKYAIARLQLGVLARFFGVSLEDELDPEKIHVARDALSAVRQTHDKYPITSSLVDGGFNLATITTCYVDEERTLYSPQHS